MAVVNTNIAASIAQAALAKRAGAWQRNGATFYRQKDQFGLR